MEALLLAIPQEACDLLMVASLYVLCVALGSWVTWQYERRRREAPGEEWLDPPEPPPPPKGLTDLEFDRLYVSQK